MSWDAIVLLAQAEDQSGGAAGLIVAVIYLAVIVLTLAGLWKVFTKAGLPGWGAIVPIYNAYLLCKVAGRPGWWVLLLIIPIVSLIVYIIVALDIAKAFGKGSGFGIGLALLGFIFFPILGFGDARYVGKKA
jgi:uncharacterized membrane protein YhaH (DUF805 family)